MAVSLFCQYLVPGVPVRSHINVSFRVARDRTQVNDTTWEAGCLGICFFFCMSRSNSTHLVYLPVHPPSSSVDRVCSDHLIHVVLVMSEALMYGILATRGYKWESCYNNNDGNIYSLHPWKMLLGASQMQLQSRTVLALPNWNSLKFRKKLLCDSRMQNIIYPASRYTHGVTTNLIIDSQLGKKHFWANKHEILSKKAGGPVVWAPLEPPPPIQSSCPERESNMGSTFHNLSFTWLRADRVIFAILG